MGLRDLGRFCFAGGVGGLDVPCPMEEICAMNLRTWFNWSECD